MTRFLNKFKRNILLSVITFGLVGCDTVAVYRIKDDPSFPEMAAINEDKYVQLIDLAERKVSLSLKLVRFNFTYYLYMRVENRSDQVISFSSRRISLLGSDSKTELTLEKIKLINELPDAVVPDNLIIPAHQKIALQYSFNGAPIMSIVHVVTAEKQKVLFLKIEDLGQEVQPLTISLNLKQ